jgi:hypothetical protein
MIAIRHTFSGIIAAAFVMIPFYIALWLIDIGGLGGMMDDDSYPFSIFLLPAIAAIFSGVAFWIGVFPFAHLGKWIGNRKNLSLIKAGFIATGCSALVGCIFGAVSGGLYAAFIYMIFLGSAAVVFWVLAAKNKVEQTGPANHRPFVTSGMAPADSASRAGAMPEASGDS